MNLRDIQNPERVEANRIEGNIVSPTGQVYPVSVGLQVRPSRAVKVAVTIAPITVFYDWQGKPIQDEYSELVNRAIDLRPPVPVCAI